MDFNYKIGIVGASGSGKTSLIMACYMAFRDRLKEIDIKPKDTTTERLLQDAEHSFKTCVPHKDTTWTPPEFENTSDTHTYNFLITFTACNQTNNINLTILDYPGQMLGNADFGREITPFLLECNALFLPIPTDILMQIQINNDNGAEEAQKRCMIAREMLNYKAACKATHNWMASKARNKQPAQLFFVPVRCEKYFSDNTATDSKDNNFLNSVYNTVYNSVIKPAVDLFISDSEHEILKAVDELYYQQIDYSSGMAECVSVYTFCVDTYGIVEECKMDIRNDKLVPEFKRRAGMGRKIKIKNAFELLASIFLFQMERDQLNINEDLEKLNYNLGKANIRFQELSKNRSFWQYMWGNTPEMTTTQNEISNLTDKINKNNTHLSIIKTFVNCLKNHYETNNQRTKKYDPEKD